jgi:hypothetical protein
MRQGIARELRKHVAILGAGNRWIGANLRSVHVLEMGVRFTGFRRQRGPPHLRQDDLALAQ